MREESDRQFEEESNWPPPIHDEDAGLANTPRETMSQAKDHSSIQVLTVSGGPDTVKKARKMNPE